LDNILPIFHFPSFYNELHLVDALIARTQTNFGSGETVYFINRNVSIKRILLKQFIIFRISCLQTEKSSYKHLNSASEVVHLT